MSKDGTKILTVESCQQIFSFSVWRIEICTYVYLSWRASIDSDREYWSCWFSILLSSDSARLDTTLKIWTIFTCRMWPCYASTICQPSTDQCIISPDWVCIWFCTNFRPSQIDSCRLIQLKTWLVGRKFRQSRDSGTRTVTGSSPGWENRSSLWHSETLISQYTATTYWSKLNYESTQ